MITIDGRQRGRLFQDISYATCKGYNTTLPLKLWRLSVSKHDYMLLMPEYTLEYTQELAISEAILHLSSSQEAHRLFHKIDILYLESIKNQSALSPWLGECFEKTNLYEMFALMPYDLCIGCQFRVIDYVACGYSFPINPNLISAADYQILK
jgi:hypothetical protein